MAVNAQIKSTFLGWEDHGIFTFSLRLEGDGWGQGSQAWSYQIDDGALSRHMKALLKAVGVSQWESLPNTFVRIKRDSRGMVSHVGHITKDQWFNHEEQQQESP